ncbi:MAG: DUF2809 domain-containing protein [Bacteroidetes bacterium]|nr:DUF2809 domain-containing protein [Bacteroidota bacterium]
MPRRTSIVLALATLLLGLLIAFLPLGEFIRGYGGDVMVVIFIFSLVRIGSRASSISIAVGVLGFAFAVEFLQLLHLADRLAFKGILRIAFGSTFDPLDLLAYLVGIVPITLFDARLYRDRME